MKAPLHSIDAAPGWSALLLGHAWPDVLPRCALTSRRIADLDATRGFTTGS